MIQFFQTMETTCDFKRNMVINGANKFIDLEHFEQVKSELFKNKDVKIEHLTNKSLIAVQGPKSAEILQKLFKQDLSKIGFMGFFHEKAGHGLNCEMTVYRTGYTGEDGFEISMPEENTEDFAKFLANEQILPAGLGSRDALRLEAGLCLHGHDLSQEISPVEALLQWTIRKKNGITSFIGEEALKTIKANPPKIKRLGIKLLESGVPRENFEVFSKEGELLGKLSSGLYSPTLKIGIGMAYLPNEKVSKEGTEIYVDIRNRKVKAITHKMPFVPTKYFRSE